MVPTRAVSAAATTNIKDDAARCVVAIAAVLSSTPCDLALDKRKVVREELLRSS